MNSCIVLFAVLLLQATLTLSGPTEFKGGLKNENEKGLFGRSHVVKRANDLLTNEIDLSNDISIDSNAEMKRLRLVQRQAEAHNAQSSGPTNSTLCDVIGSFVAQGANTVSSIVSDMARIFQQLCVSATQALLHPSRPSSST